MVAFVKVGLSLPSSNPVRMSMSFSSGKSRVTSSSRENCPRSTHCRAATAVRTFPQDAIQNVVSKSRIWEFLLPSGSQRQNLWHMRRSLETLSKNRSGICKIDGHVKRGFMAYLLYHWPPQQLRECPRRQKPFAAFALCPPYYEENRKT